MFYKTDNNSPIFYEEKIGDKFIHILVCDMYYNTTPYFGFNISKHNYPNYIRMNDKQEYKDRLEKLKIDYFNDVKDFNFYHDYMYNKIESVKSLISEKHYQMLLKEEPTLLDYRLKRVIWDEYKLDIPLIQRADIFNMVRDYLKLNDNSEIYTEPKVGDFVLIRDDISFIGKIELITEKKIYLQSIINTKMSEKLISYKIDKFETLILNRKIEKTYERNLNTVKDKDVLIIAENDGGEIQYNLYINVLTDKEITELKNDGQEAENYDVIINKLNENYLYYNIDKEMVKKFIKINNHNKVDCFTLDVY